MAFLPYFTLLCQSARQGFSPIYIAISKSFMILRLFSRGVNQLFLLAIDVMLLATSIKMLLKSCCGLQCWRSCSSHLKNIPIPLFKIFVPSNIGTITLYPPDVIILEMHLLFREVCLHLSKTSSGQPLPCFFPLFSRPVQTSHHSLKCEQDVLHPQYVGR